MAWRRSYTNIGRAAPARPDQMPKNGSRSSHFYCLLRRAETAASRRLDHEHIARLHVGRPGRAQFEPAAVRADDIGLARLTRFAAFQAKRCDPPAIGQDGRSHGFEEAHASYTAVAAAGLATPTAAFTNDVAFQQDRETPLQHFGIREARVR